MKVPDDQLRTVLGITEVKSAMKQHSLAVVDSTLGGVQMSAAKSSTS